jgi:hypothetical protein
LHRHRPYRVFPVRENACLTRLWATPHTVFLVAEMGHDRGVLKRVWRTREARFESGSSKLKFTWKVKLEKVREWVRDGGESCANEHSSAGAAAGGFPVIAK